jgi:hypothetical protein
VLAQEAKLVFGHTFVGQALFFLVQAATMLILYTGGNTSFNGFPFLTSYVAGDSFLPRWLLKRGHRLVFSNAIILLTITSGALLIIKDADVNNLVPLYAIGVFTAFSMAGFGMARYQSRHRTPGWRRRQVINFSAGVLTAIVVGIFAVVKFTEGAWVVVVLFVVLVPALIRMNREYAAESGVLETISENQPPPPPHYSRRTVFVFVDGFDLATLAALRYARSMRPTSIRAVHFVIDSVRADKLLPRRSYSALLGRLLHDRTADKIAAVVSRIPRSAATIVPYDVESRVRILQERQAAKMAAEVADVADQKFRSEEAAVAANHANGTSSNGDSPSPKTPEAKAPLSESAAKARGLLRKKQPEPCEDDGQDGGTPSADPRVSTIGSLDKPGKVAVEGRIRVVEIKPVERNSVLACEISDGTGTLTALFYGRSHIPGIVCGARVRFKGTVGIKNDHPVMINPAYELIFPSV